MTNNPIDTFLDTTTISPVYTTAVIEALPLIRRLIPQNEHRHWGRRRIIAEMAARGFPVGTGAGNRAYFVGFSVYPPDEPRRWTVTDQGRLIRT